MQGSTDQNQSTEKNLKSRTGPVPEKIRKSKNNLDQEKNPEPDQEKLQTLDRDQKIRNLGPDGSGGLWIPDSTDIKHALILSLR